MQEPDFDSFDFIRTLAFVAFAAIGGALAYILRSLNLNRKPSMVRGFVEMLASGFVGLLAMLMCDALGFDWRWSGVIVGVFGWMGAEASIMMIAKVIRKKFGVDIDVDKNSR